MKMYRVTTTDQFNDKWVHMIPAWSKREVLTKFVKFKPDETVLTIEEVD